ncbi:MAG TPA: NADP-dependent oxidoreductase [Polyangiaceae bacterium]|jgi:NADPH:quinone reductase-like Zn-dependent oxidoreductase|nr:NADP-dependent oxidoreductase [Polyangiaceae bacterium]
MKAAVLVGFGGVDQLELRDVPEPKTGVGQVKVRVIATSVNPIDWKLREGVKRPGLSLELPAILGRDAAGEVVEVGSGVTRWRLGARVAGLVFGAYAERVVANDEAWAEVPEGLRLLDAAAIPLVALTGSQLVEESLNPRPHETILVTGALGSVGRAAVFAAKGRNVKVWAGVRASQRGAAEALGLDGAVALEDDADCRRLPTLDGIADTVGASVTEKLFDRVRRGGVISSVASDPKGAQERGIEVRHHSAHPDPSRLAALVRAVAEGALVIPIAKQFALAQIREAQQFAQQGAGGKVVVRVSEAETPG